MTTELADRAGLQAGEGIGVATMVEATLEAKRHAPRAMAHAVSPWLRSSDQSMEEHAEQDPGRSSAPHHRSRRLWR